MLHLLLLISSAGSSSPISIEPWLRQIKIPTFTPAQIPITRWVLMTIKHWSVHQVTAAQYVASLQTLSSLISALNKKNTVDYNDITKFLTTGNKMREEQNFDFTTEQQNAIDAARGKLVAGLDQQQDIRPHLSPLKQVSRTQLEKQLASGKGLPQLLKALQNEQAIVVDKDQATLNTAEVISIIKKKLAVPPQASKTCCNCGTNQKNKQKKSCHLGLVDNHASQTREAAS